MELKNKFDAEHRKKGRGTSNLKSQACPARSQTIFYNIFQGLRREVNHIIAATTKRHHQYS